MDPGGPCRGPGRHAAEHALRVPDLLPRHRRCSARPGIIMRTRPRPSTWGGGGERHHLRPDCAGASVGKAGDSRVCVPGYSGGGPVVFFCHGQRPVSSTSSEKLRKVRIKNMMPSTATLVIVGSAAAVWTMSAATSSYRPGRMVWPTCAHKYGVGGGSPGFREGCRPSALQAGHIPKSPCNVRVSLGAAVC